MNEKLLIHGWGNSPEQKKKEKEYNHQYYLKNKERWQKEKEFYDKQYEQADLLSRSMDSNKYEAKTKQHITYKMPDEEKVRQDVAENDKKLKEYADNVTKLNRQISDIDKQISEIESGIYKGNMSDIKTEESRKATARRNNELWNQIRELESQKAELEADRDDNVQKRAAAQAEHNRIAKNGIESEAKRRADVEYGKKLRTQEISDAKALNEAAKANAMKEKQNKQAISTKGIKEFADKKRKQAAYQEAYNNMMAYQKELEEKKKRPITKKAREFIDGTVEVALDALTGKKSKKNTANSIDKKKKKDARDFLAKLFK